MLLQQLNSSIFKKKEDAKLKVVNTAKTAKHRPISILTKRKLFKKIKLSMIQFFKTQKLTHEKSVHTLKIFF